MTKWTEAIWLLPTEPRCLAHGIKPEGPFKSEWCELRGECARIRGTVCAEHGGVGGGVYGAHRRDRGDGGDL